MLLFLVVSSPQARATPPPLKATFSNDRRVELSWDSNPTSPVILEASETMGPGAKWSRATEGVTVSGGRAIVALSPSAATRFFRLREDPDALGDALLSVLATSPASGEADVAVTRETVFRLNGALATETVLTTNQVYATAQGRRMLSRVELSADRRQASLFYLENLPASAQIEVTFEGAGIFDERSRPLDLDGDGFAGGAARVQFQTLATAALPTAGVEGHVFASERNADGSNLPLVGVTITVDGMEETLRTTTDATGFFRLTPCPAGRFFVHVDGRTAVGSQWPGGAYYPFVGKAWEASPGRTNNLAGGSGEIFLPFIQAEALRPVSATVETKVTFAPSVVATNPAFAGVEVKVPANALFADNGARGGRVGIAPVSPDRLPEPLPPGLNFPIVITIQTDGPMNFDQPVPVRFPNLPDPITKVKLAPGAKTALWSFNHDTGLWEIVGPATVTADGNFVESDPGYGIRQPGWHAPGPGSGGCGPDCDGDGDDDCDICPDKRPKPKPDCKTWNPYCKDNPCYKEANFLANSMNDAVVDLGMTIGGGLGAAAVDCALGVAMTAARATRDCSLDIIQCASLNPLNNPIIDGAFGAAIGCVPEVGSYLGLSWTLKGVLINARSLGRCTKANASLHQVGLQGVKRGLEGVSSGASELALINQLEALVDKQIAVIEASSNVMATLLGPRWSGANSPEEMPVYRAFFERLEESIAVSSPGGLEVTPAERAAVLALARPNGNTEADVDALLARIDALRRYEFGTRTPEGRAFIDAMARMDAIVEQRTAEGWTTLNDGFFRILEIVSAFAEPGVGNPEYPGLAQLDSGPARQSPAVAEVEAFAFPAAPMAYAIVDQDSGFIRRGRLSNRGQFPPMILPPSRRFLVMYYHAESARSGAAVFQSAPNGLRTRIPAAPLGVAQGIDTDGDGLSDRVELVLGTSPQKRDSDGDGVPDRSEVEVGTNPLDGQPLEFGVVVTRVTGGAASRVAVEEDLALVAKGARGLDIYQVNEPINPVLLSQIPATTASSITEVVATAGHALVTTNGGVRILRLGDGRSPTDAGWVPTGVTPVGLAVFGKRAYAPGKVGNAETIAVIGFERVQLLGQVNLPESVGPAIQLAVIGDKLWALTWVLTTRTAALHGFRVTGDTLERLSSTDLGTYIPTTGRIGPELAVTATRAYVGSSSGFAIIDLTNPAAPKTLVPTAANIFTQRGMSLAGPSHLLTSVGRANLTVYGVGSDQNTNLLLSFATGENVQGIRTHRGYALLAQDFSSLAVAHFMTPDSGINPPTVALQPWVSHPPDQQESGELFSVTGAARDDVLVRDVEFYVDDTLVARSGGFPFQVAIRAPTRTVDRTRFVLRAKATDTGGNSAWSEPITIRLLEDTTAPRVLRVSPLPGAIVTRGSLRQLEAEFDSEISVSSLSQHWRLSEAGVDGLLGTADDASVSGASVEWNGSRSTALLDFGRALPSGRYRATLEAALADAAGNPLGTAFTWDFTIPLAKATGSVPANDRRVLSGQPVNVALTFDEVLQPSSVDASRIDLLSAGSDGVSGNGDDVAVAASGATLGGGGRIVTAAFGAALPNGSYRIRIRPGLQDVYGGAIDTNWVSRFTVTFPVEWAVDRSGAWETATNWSTGTRPVASDHIFIERPAGDYLVTVASDPTVDTLRSTEPLLINGRRLTVLDTARFDAGLILSNGASLSQGTVELNASATLVGSGNKTLANTLVRNRGVFDWRQGGLTLGGTTVFHNQAGGVFQVNKAGPPIDRFRFVSEPLQDPVRALFLNEGVLRKIGGTEEIEFEGFGLFNAGTLEAAVGALSLKVPITNRGTILVSTGARITLGASRRPGFVQTESGRVTGSGELVIDTESTIDGSFDFDGVTTVADVSATFLAPMSTRTLVTVRPPLIGVVRPLQLVRGGHIGAGGVDLRRVVTGSGVLRVEGPALWNSGGRLGGRLIWQSAGGMVITNGGIVEDEATFENRSTLHLEAGRALQVEDNARFVNLGGAVFELGDGATLRVQRDTADRRASALNLGTLRKATDAETAALDGWIANDGLVEVGTGSFRILSPGQVPHAGTFRVGPNAELRIEPSHQFLPASRIEGEGWAVFASRSTATVPGPIATVEGDYAATHTVVSNGVVSLRRSVVFPNLELSRNGVLEVDHDVTARDTLRIGPVGIFRAATSSTGLTVTSLGDSVFSGAQVTGGLRFRQEGRGRVETLGITLQDSTLENALGATLTAVGPTNGTANWSFMSGAFTGRFLNSGTVIFDSAAKGLLDVAATNIGVIEIRRGALQVGRQLTLAAGELRLSGGQLELGQSVSQPVPPLVLAGGALTGAGSIAFNRNNSVTRVLTNDATVIRPGLPIGTLAVLDSLDLRSGSVLEIELAGTSAGITHDQLNVGLRANLGGTLRISLRDGFVPSLGQEFVILTCGNRTATEFAAVEGANLGPDRKLSVVYEGSRVVLRCVAGP
ncbi:MAG: Ig-like domain-containing protein [Verrucomicrobiales bacterium]|nr:Ig-like domain-containing protein [Verrucomicrobiales bacterium]